MEEISEMCWPQSILSEIVIKLYHNILPTERFPRFGCEGNSQRVCVCAADAESLSWSDIILAQPVFDRLRSILCCFIYFQVLLFWLLFYII